mmetsp:Transcript_7374/g.16903  ORF Transcript_7374/g.16903 Transcript_7374/m.16903 type:complete len:240 (+) Transcript_7374:122-841(+)
MAANSSTGPKHEDAEIAAMQAACTIAQNTTPEQRQHAMQAGQAGARQLDEVQKRDGGVAAVGGAAVAAGVVGAVISGPILAVGAAGAATYVAATRSDAVGDAARSVGKGTMDAVNSAIKFNKDHNVTGRAYAGVKGAVQSAAALDSKYQVTSTLGNAASKTGAAAQKFAEDHKVQERAKDAAASAAAASSTAAAKARQVDAQSKISERAGAAAAQGWAMFQGAVSSSSSSTSTAPVRET